MLAKNVNDNVCFLNKHSACAFFASKLAPTVRITGKKKRHTDQVRRKNAVKHSNNDSINQSSSASAWAVTSWIRAQSPFLTHSGSSIQLPPTHITFFNAM